MRLRSRVIPRLPLSALARMSKSPRPGSTSEGGASSFFFSLQKFELNLQRHGIRYGNKLEITFLMGTRGFFLSFIPPRGNSIPSRHNTTPETRNADFERGVLGQRCQTWRGRAAGAVFVPVEGKICTGGAKIVPPAPRNPTASGAQAEVEAAPNSKLFHDYWRVGEKAHRIVCHLADPALKHFNLTTE